MGWASGSELAENIWDTVSDYIPEKAKIKVAQNLIDIFEGRDCDTMQETTLWDLANETCSACKGEWEACKNCEPCEGYGWVKKNAE